MVATQIFFMFIPTWGRSPFWRSYFSNGWFNHQLAQHCRTCEPLLRLMSIWSLDKWCECPLRVQLSRIKIMHEAIPVVRPVVTVSCGAPEWCQGICSICANGSQISAKKTIKEETNSWHQILDSFRLLNEGRSWPFNVCFPWSSGTWERWPPAKQPQPQPPPQPQAPQQQEQQRQPGWFYLAYVALSRPCQVRRPVPSVRHLDLPGPVLRWVRKTQIGYMALVGHTGGQMICGFKFN